MLRFYDGQTRPILDKQPFTSPDQVVFEWARQGSNLQPTDYESAALTIELRALVVIGILP